MIYRKAEQVTDRLGFFAFLIAYTKRCFFKTLFVCGVIRAFFSIAFSLILSSFRLVLPFYRTVQFHIVLGRICIFGERYRYLAIIVHSAHLYDQLVFALFYRNGKMLVFRRKIAKIVFTSQRFAVPYNRIRTVAPNLQFKRLFRIG